MHQVGDDSCLFSCRDYGPRCAWLLKTPMSCPILHANGPILLIGAGPIDKESTKSAYFNCDRLICADGGLHHAMSFGFEPDLVVGDFDSVNPSELKDVPTYSAPDQNFTDFEKSLACVDAPMVLATGVLGGRLDHQLATFSTLIKAPTPIIAFDGRECVFAVPPERAIQIAVDTEIPVGFYPLQSVHATTDGVRWPLTDALMAPGGLIGTSNHATDTTVHVETDGPGLLCILPVGFMPNVMIALAR